VAVEHGAFFGPKSRARVEAHPYLRRDRELAARSGAGSLAAFYALPEVEEWIADWEIEQERCKFHGGPYTECPDADADWFPQMSTCYPTMQLEAVKRRYAELHKDRPYHDGTRVIWAEKPSRLTPFHFSDGVTFWLSREDLTPDDDFLAQKAPELTAQESPGQQDEAG
jgi:hypothetical protein